MGFESHILRFGARLVTTSPCPGRGGGVIVSDAPTVDPTRKFVVSYFLSDDTILINQIPEENTGGISDFPQKSKKAFFFLIFFHFFFTFLGLTAGRFLIRSRVRNLDSPFLKKLPKCMV